MKYKIAFEEDRQWANQFGLLIRQIVEAHYHLFVAFRQGTEDEDIRQATDYVVSAPPITVAARVRKPAVPYRDLTIRYERPSGAETEYSKIKAGHGSLYFYGWASISGGFDDWMLVLLESMRGTGMLDGWDEKQWNRDMSSSFVTWRQAKLRGHGLLLCEMRVCGH